MRHRVTRFWLRMIFGGILLGLALPAAAAPPQVTKATPDNGDKSVDPALRVIRIEFDQDMDPGGYSVCGGQGIEFTGKPRWKDKRTFELPVKLKPGQKYQLSVNCPSAQNFKSEAGESATAYPITFTTRKAGAKPAATISLADKRAAIARLRAAIDDRYSYRDLRKIDWPARFTEFTPQLEKAKDWGEFARITAKLLSAAQDPHIWLTLDGETIGTFQRQAESNFNPAKLKQLVPGWKLHNSMVATGKFDDGIGYILIATWSARDKADLEPALQALQEFADAPGIILDVRANGGGSEPLAQQIAGCFVRAPVVYARNSNRDPQAPGGFTKIYDRMLEPVEPAVRAPVAVLMGPRNMSSCESFLMMMDQSPQATLVGGRSYGSSGNPKPHELSDELVVFLPSWKDLRLDGTPSEGQGVEPEITVAATADELRERDPVLERALALLRERRGSK